MRVSIKQLKRIVREAALRENVGGMPPEDDADPLHDVESRAMLDAASRAMEALVPVVDSAIEALSKAHLEGALPTHPPERGPAGAVYGDDAVFTEDAVRDLLDALDAVKNQLDVVRDMF